MSKAHLTNQKLLEILGLNGLSITSLDIACRVDELPRVTAIINPRESSLHAQVQQFELLAIDAPAEAPAPVEPTAAKKPPLDLDAMCWNATQRIREHINRSARNHMNEISREFRHLRDPARIRHIQNLTESGLVSASNLIHPKVREALTESIGSIYGLQRRGR